RLDGGKFVLDTAELGGGIALADGLANVGDQLRLESSPLDAHLVGVVFGYRSETDFYVLAASDTLMMVVKFDRSGFRQIARRDHPRSRHHSFSLHLKDREVSAEVDGTEPWIVSSFDRGVA